MSIGLFIWTFDGVMKAIALGLFLLAVSVFGLLLGVAHLLDWWEARRRKKANNTDESRKPAAGLRTPPSAGSAGGEQ